MLEDDVRPLQAMLWERVGADEVMDVVFEYLNEKVACDIIGCTLHGGTPCALADCRRCCRKTARC